MSKAIASRVSRLEKQHGKPDEKIEFLGETMTRTEFEALLRAAEGSTTQARIDPSDNQP